MTFQNLRSHTRGEPCRDREVQTGRDETMSQFVLCGCLMEETIETIPGFLEYPGIDRVEWRLDVLSRHNSIEDSLRALSILSLRGRHPVIATNRPERFLGSFGGPEKLRLEVLRKAAEAGAEWIDIEDDVPLEAIEALRATGARILLSHHDYDGTPDRRSLGALLESLARFKPDAIKITTFARQAEDNLRVLELIPFARRELGIEVVSFCMGPLGRWSRFACLPLGSPWTYVQFPDRPAAGPGQFTATEMRSLIELAGEEPQAD